MKIRLQIFNIGYQCYITPTLLVTHNPILHGGYDIQLRWLKWGVELHFKPKQR